MSNVRLRFAPSPTGFLHIGGARTAIFNYLLARKTGGSFLLRIEDTDKQRSKQEYEDDILDAIRWLGLEWDEEPLRQSKRKTFHQEMVDELIERRKAFRCFLTPEETQKLKQEREAMGIHTAFRSPYRDIDPEESEEKMIAGKPFAVRFYVPDEPVVYIDGVHGKVEIPADSIEDFVLLRTDGTPTYQVAVVGDDYEMGITHVVRGDDHISNTPKQILIYKALGWTAPEFAHVPLILGPDKKRLSKRHGAAAVTEYREKGYLPEAILSFMAMLGWSPGDDRELMTHDELVEVFTTEGINKRSAVFDERKLEWVNGQFLSMREDDDILEMLKQPFADRVADGRLPAGAAKMLPIAIHLLKSRSHFPADILDRGDYFFKEPETVDAKAAKKRLKDPETPAWLDELASRYNAIDEFTVETTEQVIRVYSEELEVGAGNLIHPIRLAVSGQPSGPGLFELLEGLGKETVVRRLKWLAEFLREKGTPPDLEE